MVFFCSSVQEMRSKQSHGDYCVQYSSGTGKGVGRIEANRNQSIEISICQETARKRCVQVKKCLIARNHHTIVDDMISRAMTSGEFIGVPTVGSTLLKP